METEVTKPQLNEQKESDSQAASVCVDSNDQYKLLKLFEILIEIDKSLNPKQYAKN